MRIRKIAWWPRSFIISCALRSRPAVGRERGQAHPQHLRLGKCQFQVVEYPAAPRNIPLLHFPKNQSPSRAEAQEGHSETLVAVPGAAYFELQAEFPTHNPGCTQNAGAKQNQTAGLRNRSSAAIELEIVDENKVATCS